MTCSGDSISLHGFFRRERDGGPAGRLCEIVGSRDIVFRRFPWLATFFGRYASSSQRFRSQVILHNLDLSSGTPDSGVIYRFRDERWFTKHHLFPRACAVDHHILCILRGRHFYSDPNFPGVKSGCSNWPHLRELSKAERMEELSRHRLGFKGLREV